MRVLGVSRVMPIVSECETIIRLGLGSPILNPSPIPYKNELVWIGLIQLYMKFNLI